MNSGGPAFPHHKDDVAYGCTGMTLRQYYASAAMQTLMGKTASIEVITDIAEKLKITTAVLTARIAFEFADAMIAFEEEPKETK